MRAFILQRHEDVSGVSGVGVVAEGVQFTDGTVVLRWRTEYRTTEQCDSVDVVEKIHGHGGATELIWLVAEKIPQTGVERE